MAVTEKQYKQVLQENADLKKSLNLANKRRGHVVASLTEAFVKTYGEGAWEVASKAQAYEVQRFVERHVKEKTVESNARGAVEILSLLHNAGGVIGEVVESTPERAVRQERNCPWEGVWTLEMCQRFDPRMMKTICTVLNPKLTLSRPKFLTGGDGCCEYIFEMKD